MKISSGIALLLLIGISYCIFPFDGEEFESGDIFIQNSAKNGSKGDSLFYYLIKARNKTADKKLIIWLSGGPGVSSTFDLFLTNGPYTFNKTLGLTKNPYSWNNDYDIVYVDQPIGTGNSLLKDADNVCKDEHCVARNFYTFLQYFQEKYPEYKKKPHYMFGASYAGHYIPAIASYLLKANNSNIALKGIGIGNGYTNVQLEQQKCPTYLYENGLISAPAALMSHIGVMACNIALLMKIPELVKSCFNIGFMLGVYFKIPNLYDISAKENYSKRSYALYSLMTNKGVMKALNAEDRVFNQYQMMVFKAMIEDKYHSEADNLAYVVDSGISVILYYGDKDYVCHWMGGEDLSNSLIWKNTDKFRKAEYKPWTVDNKATGKYRKVDNLMFLVVYNAGHLVPMDTPYEALEMLNRFINDSF